MWYDGVPGFRRKGSFEKLLNIVKVALLFPLYCVLYMMAPNCKMGVLMRKPFMKFLIHASSYLFFLCMYIFPLVFRIAIHVFCLNKAHFYI